MDLLEKIQFNKVIHGAMAQIHSPLLSHQDIQDVQTNLNNLLVHCSYEQIVKQTHALLQQATLKSMALYYAEDTKHFQYYVGMVFSPIELVEHLTQHGGMGWGILSKNNSLWQIFLKLNNTKNIEYSIWVEHLNELTPWLDSKFASLNKKSIDTTDELASQVQPIDVAEEAIKDELPELDTEFTVSKEISEDDFNQFLLDSQIKTKETAEELDLPSLTFSEDVVNPFTAMKADLDKEKSSPTDADVKSLTELSVDTHEEVNLSSNTQDIEDIKLSTTNHIVSQLDSKTIHSSTTTHQQNNTHIEQVTDNHSENKILLETVKQQAAAQLTAQQQLALTPDLIEQIAAALANKLKTESLASLSTNVPVNHRSVTPSAKISNNELAVHTDITLESKPETVKPIPAKPVKSTIDYSFTIDSLVAEDTPIETSKSIESLTIDFSSPISSLLPTNQQNHKTVQALANDISQSSKQILTETAKPVVPSILSKNKIVEEWDCNFELGTELDLTFYYIQLKKYIPYLNLIALNTDMATIQHQPIYMVEVIDEQNQFKHYAIVFGAENSNQAINFINQLAHHQQDHLAHIAQITWREFKEHAFDLSLCCQLYHTSPVIMRSASLYSHISESLISKQQMLYISEVDANSNTPLLLLQENSRFRIIHGQNRLNMGATLNMYPCLILSRSSGITWQMIREQLKYLPEKVNVYQLFEALQHSSKH